MILAKWIQMNKIQVLWNFQAWMTYQWDHIILISLERLIIMLNN